jgi:hypothetical protein
MHFEILIEDSSGTRLVEHLMPKLVGPANSPHTWRVHPYKGIGRLPANLGRASHPAQRQLLSKLPLLLRGYAKTPGYDAIIVVCDTDARDCAEFLGEFREVARSTNAEAITMFRLAIEEIEAWYLGDKQALLEAYPRANRQLLETYQQDSIGRTWERLADIVHPGGSRAILRSGWPAPGDIKHEWANRIGALMDPDRNRSPSFGKFREGVRRLATRQ